MKIDMTLFNGVDNCITEAIQETKNNVFTLSVNQKYLGGSLIDAVAMDNKFICVKSPMGSGKTYALRELIKNNRYESVLYITAGAPLTKSASLSLGLHHYSTFETNKKEREAIAQKVSVTVQSLYKITNVKSDYDLVIFDESEQNAIDFVSRINTRKEDNLKAFAKLKINSRKMLFMDALLGTFTSNLLECFRIKPATLINSYQPLKNVPIDIVESGNSKDKHNHLLNIIEMAINDNERVYVPCSSKTKAKKINDYLINKGINNVISFTADNINQEKQQEVIRDSNNILKYQIVIASPVIGSGISFDYDAQTGAGFFDLVAGSFTNNAMTASVQQTAQQLARARGIGRIFLVIDDQEGVIYDNQLTDQEYMQLLVKNFLAGSEGGEQLTVDENLLLTLAIKNVQAQEKYKNNFKEILYGYLNEMGINTDNRYRASKTDKALVNKSDDIYKIKIGEEYRAIKNSECIDDKEAELLKAIRRRGYTGEDGIKLCDDEQLEIQQQLEKYRLENTYLLEFKNLNFEQSLELFTQDKKDARLKAERRSKALASTDFDKKYKQWLYKTKDIADTRQKYTIEKKLLKLALKFNKNGVISDKSVMNNKDGSTTAFYNLLLQEHKNIRALFPLLLGANWKDKPYLVVNKLLKRMGYDTRHSSKNGETTVSMDKWFSDYYARLESKDATFEKFMIEVMKGKKDEEQAVIVSTKSIKDNNKRAITNALLSESISYITKLLGLPYLAPDLVQKLARLLLENKAHFLRIMDNFRSRSMTSSELENYLKNALH